MMANVWPCIVSTDYLSGLDVIYSSASYDLVLNQLIADVSVL